MARIGFIPATVPLKTLSPDNDTVQAGRYLATLLSTVDPDLAVGNIKLAVDIFGKVGTFVGAPTETIERESHGELAAGATYAPSDPGIYQLYQGHTGSQGEIHTEVYCTTNTTWYDIPGSLDSYQLNAFCTEGASARIKNVDGSYAQEYSLIRIHISGGTYEEVLDKQMAASEIYTPVASSSLFGGGEGYSPKLEYQRAEGTWYDAQQMKGTGFCPTDGTNIRFKESVAAAKYATLLRAKLI